jgi:hypothetical protein
MGHYSSDGSEGSEASEGKESKEGKEHKDVESFALEEVAHNQWIEAAPVRGLDLSRGCGPIEILSL